MSFCVAGMAHLDILTCLQMVSKVVFYDRRNTFARFSEDDFHFSWHAEFGRVHVACFLRIALSGLHQVVTTCKLRGRRGASRECHFAFRARLSQFFMLLATKSTFSYEFSHEPQRI